MKRLSEFETLQEAQEYNDGAYRLVSPELFRAFLAETQTYVMFKSVEQIGDYADMIAAMQDQMATGGEWNFSPNHPVGKKNLDFLSLIIAQPELFNLTVQDAIKVSNLQSLLQEYSDTSTYPYTETTQEEFDLYQPEEVALVNSIGSQTFTLSIEKSAPAPTTVRIMQRYGSGPDDLTEWHQCAQFSNVRYKQQGTWVCSVAAVPAAYRELKAVCAYSLGLSVSL